MTGPFVSMVRGPASFTDRTSVDSSRARCPTGLSANEAHSEDGSEFDERSMMIGVVVFEAGLSLDAVSIKAASLRPRRLSLSRSKPRTIRRMG
jgi:hypothetical protein